MTLPTKFYLPIFIISIGFGILATQYFESILIGIAVSMAVGMLMITEAESSLEGSE